jgi:hypothetical protein
MNTLRRLLPAELPRRPSGRRALSSESRPLARVCRESPGTRAVRARILSNADCASWMDTRRGNVQAPAPTTSERVWSRYRQKYVEPVGTTTYCAPVKPGAGINPCRSPQSKAASLQPSPTARLPMHCDRDSGLSMVRGPTRDGTRSQLDDSWLTAGKDRRFFVQH